MQRSIQFTIILNIKGQPQDSNLGYIASRHDELALKENTDNSEWARSKVNRDVAKPNTAGSNIVIKHVTPLKAAYTLPNEIEARFCNWGSDCDL